MCYKWKEKSNRRILQIINEGKDSMCYEWEENSNRRILQSRLEMKVKQGRAQDF